MEFSENKAFAHVRDVTPSEKEEERRKWLNWPVWRIGNFSNIPTLISQRSYHISSQTRWYPLAPDKTYLS